MICKYSNSRSFSLIKKKDTYKQHNFALVTSNVLPIIKQKQKKKGQRYKYTYIRHFYTRNVDV